MFSFIFTSEVKDGTTFGVSQEVDAISKDFLLSIADVLLKIP